MKRSVTRMTIHDAGHYTPEQREAIIASYPAYQRDARTKGIPVLGSGRIFPLAQEDIEIEPFVIPGHWVQIGGLDFGGWDHPTAAVKLVWDRDTDKMYITAAYKKKMENPGEITPVIHAAALKPWGKKLQWAWPHDGFQRDKGNGKEMRKQYQDQGLEMLPEHATYEDGGIGIDEGVLDILERMQTDRFKVFNNLLDWFAEFLLYHRKDGKVVKEFEDLMSATRYAYMMKRFAMPVRVVRELSAQGYSGPNGWLG